jgi:rhamnosyltransferase
MIRRDEVLAVVVTHRPDDGVTARLGALASQVGAVVVVDNGSPADALDAAARLPGVEVRALGSNRGLGVALNEGVRAARALGAGWLLTMDQDSEVEPGLFAAYSAAHDRAPGCRSFSPEIVSESAARDAGGADHEVAYAITSGHLVHLSVFDAAGEYDEGFFIDCIDFDFCLRLRTAGISTVRVHGARMRHQLGDAVDVPRWLRPFYARHSATRRYYMYRNYGFLLQRHLGRFPGFVIKLGVLQAVLTLFIAVYDVRPVASYRAAWRGVRDFIGGRTGPIPAGVA